MKKLIRIILLAVIIASISILADLTFD